MSKMRQEVQFLELPGEDFKCPVCFEILQEPHLTTCCGNHHICKVCLEKVRNTSGTCPLCQMNPFTGFIDKRFERQLNEFKVYCLNKKEGCQWIGGFGKIHQHLNIEESNGECQFVIVKCSNSVKCKKQLFRKDLADHVMNYCKYREVQCMYCGLVSTYEEITTSHANNCTKYPMLCQNGCSSQTYSRDQLDTHLRSCPEQEVDCTFSEMGCKEKMKCRFLQEHLERNLLQHQLIISEAFKEMKKEKQAVEEQLVSLKNDKKELEIKVNEMLKLSNQMLKLSNQEDNQIKGLKSITIPNNRSLYFRKMAEFSNLHLVAPLVLKASFYIEKQNYQNATNHCVAVPYQSQVFYSHHYGYKLQLSAEVVCHCSGCTKPQEKTNVQPTHEAFVRRVPLVLASNRSQYKQARAQISLLVNLYILKGDHDAQLKWPFLEKVTITAYQENEFNYHTVESIFEGNQNYASSGSKLSINSLPEKKKNDDHYVHPQLGQNLEPRYRFGRVLPTQRQQFHFMEPDDVPASYVEAPQQNASVATEKGLTFPLNLVMENAFGQQRQLISGGRNEYNETVYFEVTFSP